jgi:hypothetical protein
LCSDDWSAGDEPIGAAGRNGIRMERMALSGFPAITCVVFTSAAMHWTRCAPFDLSKRMASALHSRFDRQQDEKTCIKCFHNSILSIYSAKSEVTHIEPRVNLISLRKSPQEISQVPGSFMTRQEIDCVKFQRFIGN